MSFTKVLIGGLGVNQFQNRHWASFELEFSGWSAILESSKIMSDVLDKKKFGTDYYIISIKYSSEQDLIFKLDSLITQVRLKLQSSEAVLTSSTALNWLWERLFS